MHDHHYHLLSINCVSNLVLHAFYINSCSNPNDVAHFPIFTIEHIFREITHWFKVTLKLWTELRFSDFSKS